MRRCSLLLVRDHPDRSFGRCSKKAPGRRSAARQRLKPFRIPSPLDPDVRGGTFDVTEIFGRKFNVSGSEVFFKAMYLSGARDRNDPRLLREQPRKRDLSGCRLLLFRESIEQINERLVRFTIRRVKARDCVAEIRVVELRIFVDLAREKALTKGTKWNKSDSEFFERRQHRLFRLPPPQRVFALKCSDQLNRVCTADRLNSCFTKTEVLDLTFVDEALHRSRDVFDRHVQIDAMLVEEIDRINLESLERRLSDLFDVLRATI